MLQEVDWVLNEAGDIETTALARKMVGNETKMVTCLANWNRQDPAEIVPAAIKNNVGLYGFAKPVNGWQMPPVDFYLSQPVDSLKGDSRNIAVLVRAYKNLPLDFVIK